MKFILGKKIEMTQIWKGDNCLAVTKIQAGPCPVVQVKNSDKDGYEAIQIGFGEKKEKNIRKPQKGHFAKVKKENKEINPNIRFLKEFRCEDNVNVGDIIDVSAFSAGDTIRVIGTSKGKGFQGVVRRHGFHGQDATHGHKDQARMPGSIGATDPQRVFKGVRMGGRMGGDRVTVKNLEIVEIDQENNIIFIKGAVPGARNSLVIIEAEGELKVRPRVEEKVEIKEEVKEEVASEVSEKAEENGN